MHLDLPAWGEKTIERSESVIYSVVAIVLIFSAAAVLVQSIVTLFGVFTGAPSGAAVKTLDLLLLVFILVELLFAVRALLVRRELIAEPFLLVGIIASIKEIVVLSIKAPDLVGTEKFDDTLGLIGVLIAGVLLLALAAWLLRRKEREPSEAAHSGLGEEEVTQTPTDTPAENSSEGEPGVAVAGS
jgi:uncharacterized membrane protein (DUF373 family)